MTAVHSHPSTSLSNNLLSSRKNIFIFLPEHLRLSSVRLQKERNLCSRLHFGGGPARTRSSSLNNCCGLKPAHILFDSHSFCTKTDNHFIFPWNIYTEVYRAPKGDGLFFLLFNKMHMLSEMWVLCVLLFLRWQENCLKSLNGALNGFEREEW